MYCTLGLFNIVSARKGMGGSCNETVTFYSEWLKPHRNICWVPLQMNQSLFTYMDTYKLSELTRGQFCDEQQYLRLLISVTGTNRYYGMFRIFMVSEP